MQKASEIFANGKMPESLKKSANPKPLALDLESYEDTVLTVAVIDDGVDYNNPVLQKKMAYTKDESGKIIGVGKDILGQDNFAHPTLIDGSLYAFGSEKVDEQGIHGPQKDIINYITNLNDKIVRDFLKQLKENAKLDQKFYSRFTDESFSMVAIHALSSYNLHRIDYVSTLKGHIQKLKDDEEENALARWMKEQLTTSNLKNNSKMIELYANRKPYTFALYTGEHTPYMERELGLPYLDSDDAKRFYSKFIQDGFAPQPLEFLKIINQIAEKYSDELHTGLKNLEKYMLISQKFQGMRYQEDKVKSIYRQIQKVIYAHKFGFYPEKEIHDPKETICNSLSKKELDEYEKLSPEQKQEFFLKKFTESFEFGNFSDQYLVHDSSIYKDYIIERREKGSLKQIKQYVLLALKNRGMEDFLCFARPHSFKQKQRYLDYTQRYSSPLHDENSAGSSHGTHVSGIITSQDPSLRIFPVRVITGTTAKSPNRNLEIFNFYKSKIELWAQQPHVVKAIAGELGSELGLDQFNGKVSIKDFGKKLSSLLMSKYEKELLDKDSSGRLDYYFIEELFKAIQAVSQNKIKIANISLGTNFERSVNSSNKFENKKEKALNSISREFLKSVLGDILTTEAKNTLFVVAAGNDGKWVDGNTRSALPCDLSPSFKLNAKEKSAFSNGRVKNILCVGSMGKDGTLSPFTNILLTDTPFLLSYGESIKSTISTGDCSEVESFFEQLKGFQNDLNFEEIDDWGDYEEKHKLILSEHNYLPSLNPHSNQKEHEKIVDKEISRLNKSLELIQPLYDMSKKYTCLRRSRKDGHMSGTSMATPAATGFIGKVIKDMLNDKGLTENEAYINPEFAPQEIIKTVMQNSPKYQGQESGVTVLEDIKSFEQAVYGEDKQLKAQRVTKFLFIE